MLRKRQKHVHLEYKKEGTGGEKQLILYSKWSNDKLSNMNSLDKLRLLSPPIGSFRNEFSITIFPNTIDIHSIKNNFQVEEFYFKNISVVVQYHAAAIL